MNNFQRPPRYTVEHDGKFTTIRTNGGAVGAWRGIVGRKPSGWEEKDQMTTVVDGDTVTRLDY
jgi:hypothetical protein